MDREDTERGERGLKAVSVVIPVFNEEQNISPLHRELKAVMEEMGGEYEVIFVDDGSGDGSGDVLRELAQGDERMKVIEFRKNFGQTAAIAAGVEHARGEIIVTMDGDGQNDPRDIPRLLRRLEEGYDVASGWRKKREEPFLRRKFPSIIANKLISLLTRVKLHDYGCTLKAYRRDVLKDVRLYGEMHRFIPAYASWVGARISEMEVTDHPRRYGTSKYGLSRTVSIVLDLITILFLQHYSTKPIRLFGGAGMISLSVGAIAGLFVLYRRVFLGGVWISPMIFISFLFAIMGVMLTLMGLIAEIIIRTYHESQGKPIYVVKSMINFK
ncbi:MAG: glycosyltransferase family 2 protein [Deltaproteobacteria bacterium]|nr:MAG: glycosyltransferase family 2 protein [Deltaproteobacteria bacterium]